MSLRLIHISFLLLPGIIAHTSSAQSNEAHIQKWISALSVKRDDQSKQYRAVVNDLLTQDSAIHCSLLKQMQENGPSNNPRFQIRLSLLESFLRLGKGLCTGAPEASVLLKAALQKAYEIEDNALLFNVHQGLTALYINEGKFSNAALHAMIAMELAEKLGRDNVYMSAGSWYDLGYILFHSREYRGSIAATRKSLLANGLDQFSGDTLSLSYKMNAWNTIGLAYEKLGIPDSAFFAFDKAMSIADLQKNAFWRGVITGNKGDVYYQQGQYDSAAAMLFYDYQQSMAAGQYDNAANSLQWLARIDLYHDKPQEALSKLREVMQLLKRYPLPVSMQNTLYGFTQVFTKLNQADSVNFYMGRYLILHDSIEKEAFNSRAEIVNMRMENNDAVHKIQVLNKEKRSIALVRNLFIIIIILTTAFGYMYINRSRLKLKLAQQKALEEKRIAEAEIGIARDQLSVFTQNLMEKTNLVESLQERLMTRENSEAQRQYIAELSQHTILTEADWEKFKRLFEKVHPGFFQSLKQKSEDITLAEQRMAALCKLQVPVKEAANLLGISTNSVNKTRQRLRHRLGLDPEANLELYFSSHEVI